MDSDSDGGSEGEQRLLSLQPLGGDDDDNEHQDQPARHVKLGDFSFLPKELHLTTDAGPAPLALCRQVYTFSHALHVITLTFPLAAYPPLLTVVLARYLQHVVATDPARWRDKIALELGAGTGVVACALGSLHVPGLHVWSTDLQQLLPLARQNLFQDKSKKTAHVYFDIEICFYRGHPLPEDIPHQADLLLLADCIYLETTFPWLVHTMSMLSTEATEILLCYKKRRAADRRFFAILKKRFTFDHVMDDPHRSLYDREGLHLYRVWKKPGPPVSDKARHSRPGSGGTT
ncbi:MAG: hypothetical protein CYPHOPRED_003491 [Cyphobasidiales sp. Tagirdzhanova-0007]|nr:MAG: hypothetical protein CYPHOPRED_003491 [Cyphobasidiales sp. Tagirdzhanova-0007]